MGCGAHQWLARSHAHVLAEKSDGAVKSFVDVIGDFFFRDVALAYEAVLHVEERDEFASFAEVLLQHYLMAGSVFQNLCWFPLARAHQHWILHLVCQVVDLPSKHSLDSNRRVKVDSCCELFPNSSTLVPDRPASPAEAHHADGFRGQFLLLEMLVDNVHIGLPGFSLPFFQESRELFRSEVCELTLVPVVEIGHDDIVSLLGKFVTNAFVAARGYAENIGDDNDSALFGFPNLVTA
mmetsp:Transcript_3175/g.5974  ORF Transcript_3175/g.5974 Transcript_3175/m.5974 type:complete len:237 (-) Transcript_3175:146-856(-)